MKGGISEKRERAIGTKVQERKQEVTSSPLTEVGSLT